jgi:hypothetical protein
MNKKQFLNDSAVESFIDWLSSNISKIEINLKIGKSKFVQNPINEKIIGIDKVLQRYQWKSIGMQSGSWGETKARLGELSAKLRSALSSKDENATLDACKNILAWGGNRNWNVGAYPFLQRKAKAGTLCNYISKAGTAMLLSDADTTKLSPAIEKMNAMLTKVHALYTEDGLPIYDSRVAAAIASLVELWRKRQNLSGVTLPPTLSFPATVSTRSVYQAFPDTQFDPGLIGYDAESSIAWASAKVRLGFILQAVLERNSVLFSGENRMHAFEACLFMIGYNVKCLADHAIDDKVVAKKTKFLNNKLIKNRTNNNPVKVIPTLSGTGSEIHYFGDLETGFNLAQWGTTKWYFEPEFLENLFNDFSGRSNVQLGAHIDGSGHKDSLGVWMKNEQNIPPKYASALAPILVNEGLIESKGKSRFSLNFPEQE